MNAAKSKLTESGPDRIQEDRKAAEDRLCRYLWFKTKVDVRQGVTTPQQRIANIRALILEKGMADEVLQNYNDRPETYRAYCRRALSIDLDAAAEFPL